MDRNDDLMENRESERMRGADRDDTTKREGDVLGLGGTVVPKAPGDPTTEYDQDSVHQRRSRALGDDVVRRPADDQHGATGIDMGASGHGTDLAPR